jgi:hypothetical protein
MHHNQDTTLLEKITTSSKLIVFSPIFNQYYFRLILPSKYMSHTTTLSIYYANASYH